MNPIPLQKLLALIATDNKEVARLEKMIIELKEEDATLLKTLEIDDTAQFKALSTIRLKEELCESKVPQLQERLQNYYGQLLGQCDASAIELNQEVDVKVEAETRKLLEAILPFNSDPNAAATIANRLKYQMDGPIQKLLNLTVRGVRSDYREDPIKCANLILNNWAELSKSA